MVATDGDVVAIALLDAAPAYELIPLDVDVFGVLEQDADGPFALETVATDDDAAIDAGRCLWRFGGEHDCRGAIPVGGAGMLDAVALDQDMLYGACFAPAEFSSQLDGGERASADIVARNGDIARFQQEGTAIVVRHSVVLNTYAWEPAVVVHEAFLLFQLGQGAVQRDCYPPVGPGTVGCAYDGFCQGAHIPSADDSEGVAHAGNVE